MPLVSLGGVASRVRLLVWLLLCLPLTLSATSGFLQIGYGAKSKAMGGAAIAFPQDSFAAAANPAGIGLLCNRIDGGVHYLKHNGRLRLVFDDGNQFVGESGASRHGMWWPEVGIVLRPRACHALGLACFVAGEWNIDFGKPLQPYGTTTLKSRYTQYFLTPAWAVHINRCHTFGVAVNVAFTHFNAGGFEDLEQPNERTASSMGTSVRVGWIGRPVDCIAAGLTYQTRTWLGRYRRYQQLITQPIDLPAQLGLGITWFANCRWTMAFDAVKVFWRQIKAFSNEFTDPSSGLGWDDQLILKLGLAWLFRPNIILRIGYNHGNTVLPGSQGFLNAIDMEGIENHFTLGASVCLRRWGELSIAYLHGFRHTVAGTPLNVVSTDLVSRQNSVALEYGHTF